MKTKLLILATGLFMGNHLCFGQGELPGKELKPIVFNHAPLYAPLYVLKGEQKTVEIDPKKNESLDLNSLDKSYVKLIKCLSTEESREKYGERGSNGVVVIVFKDSYILSKEALVKLKWVQ